MSGAHTLTTVRKVVVVVVDLHGMVQVLNVGF